MLPKTAPQIWETALGEIQLQVSKSNYRTWFEKTIGLSYQGNQFVIGVPSTFVAEYLEKNQRSLIEKALIGFTSATIQVAFQVNGKPHHPTDIGQMEIITGNPACPCRFNPNYVFDTFVEGTCNRLARATALAVIQKPGQCYNPLFIYGGAGLGKTHLLHAIGQAALANNIRAICVSAERFTNEFVKAIREKRMEEFHHKYRNAGMLLIDDIQFISGKEQTAESFFHTFNDLHNDNRQIVITSDCSPQSMPQLAERLRSRFEWGLVVDIQPPDCETRLAILKAKAQQPDVVLSPEVLEFIARQAQQNIRELEGSLNRVVAYARLLSTTPTVDLAAKALENIAGKKPKKASLTPGLIIDVVADSFQLSPEDLVGQRRGKEIALARRVAMHLAREETGVPLTKIGLELGGRDAAAVTNASKKVRSDIITSPYLKRKISQIQQKIHNSY